jgi:16S rRNA (cytosine1402-N4)-methyltransferase
LAPDDKVDGVLMDLGVSSHQIDDPNRGFAYGADGPLDMRMDKGALVAGKGTETNIKAYDIINNWDVSKIADMLYELGDEPRSRRIAAEIVASRPMYTTGELEALITRISSYKERIKTLARCFQAVRIAVNDEMGSLEQALLTTHDVVRPGGTLVVMSYHSLEDRRIKSLMKHQSLQNKSNLPGRPQFQRAVTPSEAEIKRNRRARSARLRVATRLGVDDEEFNLPRRYKHDKYTAMKKVGLRGNKEMEKMKQES